MNNENRTAWLIENGEQCGKLKYLQFRPYEGMFGWTDDVYSALHLSRRVDAEMIAQECEEARIVEHAFALAVWSKEPPKEQGWYWHWNGDSDCRPLPTSVLRSGASNNCFVSCGQLGIDHAIDCDVYGGWWMKMIAPKPPTL